MLSNTMTGEAWRKHLNVNRNMRYPVEMILDLLGAGMSFADILADYPDLEREDLQACLLFAGKLVKVNSIHKVLAA